MFLCNKKNEKMMYGIKYDKWIWYFKLKINEKNNRWFHCLIVSRSSIITFCILKIFLKKIIFF